jgi:endonuclease/exonuclease/phosphatase family metal-dependent hydrolase
MKKNFGSLFTKILGILTFAAVTGLVVLGIAGDLVNKPGSIQASTLAPADTSQPGLRFATWNVRDCAATEASTGERLSFHDSIAQTIMEEGIDIIAFQEIQADSGSGGDIALLSVALAKAGWAMPYTAVVDAKGSDDLAIFSRFKILEQGPVLSPASPALWPRPGIFSRIQVRESTIDVYGFHFKAMSDPASIKARLNQAAALAGHLLQTYGPRIASTHIIVAGDLNTTGKEDLEGPGSTLSILTLRSDETEDNDFLPTNFEYLDGSPTFLDSRYSSVLDHVVVSPSLQKGLSKKDVKIIEGKNGKGSIPASDHRMVVLRVLF